MCVCLSVDRLLDSSLRTKSSFANLRFIDSLGGSKVGMLLGIPSSHFCLHPEHLRSTVTGSLLFINEALSYNSWGEAFFKKVHKLSGCLSIWQFCLWRVGYPVIRVDTHYLPIVNVSKTNTITKQILCDIPLRSLLTYIGRSISSATKSA